MTELSIVTDEEAFSYISSALIKQKERSVGIGEECAYRGFSSTAMSELSKRLFGTVDYSNLDEEQNDLFNESLYELIDSDIRCAVGHIIDDSCYDTSIEGESIESDYVIALVDKSNPDWDITSKSLEMLKKLQRIHDAVKPSYWELTLSKFKFDENGNFSHSSESE